MHTGDADKPSGRFDDETARRILERASAEQQRLSNESSDAWSAEELAEIAAEAGISPEALQAAVAAHTRDPGCKTVRQSGRQTRRSRFSRLNPRNWTGKARGAALTGGGVAFVGALLLFPAFAQTVLWVLFLTVIALAVLMLPGASPV